MIERKAVAQRLLACVRHSDTVSRRGGGEFVVLLPQITHAADAAASAQKVIRALVAPHDVVRHRIHLTVTVGVSIDPDDGSDAETLVRCADTEMSRAKDSGRKAYRYFERHMDEPAVGSASRTVCLPRTR